MEWTESVGHFSWVTASYRARFVHHGGWKVTAWGFHQRDSYTHQVHARTHTSSTEHCAVLLMLPLFVDTGMYELIVCSVRRGYDNKKETNRTISLWQPTRRLLCTNHCDGCTAPCQYLHLLPLCACCMKSFWSRTAHVTGVENGRQDGGWKV